MFITHISICTLCQPDDARTREDPLQDMNMVEASRTLTTVSYDTRVFVAAR